METFSRACGHCGSQDTQVHCGNPQCTWIECLRCHKVTDTRAGASS